MIERYRPEAISRVWETQHKYELMLRVELLACKAMEKLGGVPVGSYERCRKAAEPLDKGFDHNRIKEIEAEVKHDVVAFLTYVNEVIGPDSRHLHKGMTSSDVVDTVFSMQMKESASVILDLADGLLDSLKRLSLKHADTVCMGRSHGVHAEPTTFGFKMAVYWDSIKGAVENFREASEASSIGKLSGAVGVFSHFPMEVEELVCRELGLRPSPISTQIIQREVFARYFQALALLATSLENFAVEVRHLQRTEVGEVGEGFRAGQKGSSAMPHKKNPILSENITGLARVVRGYANSALDNVVLWHERDISHSSVERIIAPDATSLVAFMLKRATSIVENLVVNEEAMLRNIRITKGAFKAQRLMLSMVESGMTREEAYSLAQRRAFESFENPQSPSDSGLSPEDTEWYTRRVRKVLNRVFSQN